MQFIYSKKFN